MPYVKHPQSVCRFGIDWTDITPPIGIYHRMWGAASHDRSTGTHCKLFATAMVFEPLDPPAGSDWEQILVTVDHVLLWSKEMDGLLNSVSAQTGIERDKIAVTFSHTHAAGLMGLERVDSQGGDLIPDYLETMAKRISESIMKARDSLHSVNISYGFGSCTLAAHRDFWDEQGGQFVCGYNPDGPADDEVLIARVNRSDGEPVAVIVNYACHPTTLAWDNTLISPDFIGAMRETVELETGVPCVFLQGASGDLGPREGFSGSTRLADQNGRQLGYAVLSELVALGPPASKYVYTGSVTSGATIGTWEHQPLNDAELEHLTNWRLHRGIVELPYRSGIPTIKETKLEMYSWREKERQAREAGNEQGAQNCRAMAERFQRILVRLEALPPGDHFPFPFVLWRIGDAIWLAVEAELYHWFQVTLRKRFPDTPIFVITLTNGSRCSYLPTADAYGKGIYQETIAFLEKGSLEQLLEAVDGKIRECLQIDTRIEP